jgi:hypothetical protein
MKCVEALAALHSVIIISKPHEAAAAKLYTHAMRSGLPTPAKGMDSTPATPAAATSAGKGTVTGVAAAAGTLPAMHSMPSAAATAAGRGTGTNNSGK